MEHVMIQKLSYTTIEHLVILVPANFKKTLVISKVYCFVYLSGLIQSYMKVTLSALIQEMKTRYHLVHLNELMKDLVYPNDLLKVIKVLMNKSHLHIVMIF